MSVAAINIAQLCACSHLGNVSYHSLLHAACIVIPTRIVHTSIKCTAIHSLFVTFPALIHCMTKVAEEQQKNCQRVYLNATVVPQERPNLKSHYCVKLGESLHITLTSFLHQQCYRRLGGRSPIGWQPL